MIMSNDAYGSFYRHLTEFLSYFDTMIIHGLVNAILSYL
jgi:hypothetical protein